MCPILILARCRVPGAGRHGGTSGGVAVYQAYRTTAQRRRGISVVRSTGEGGVMTRMRTVVRPMIFAVVAILATGCASSGSGGSGGGAGVLSREQLIETRQANLYAAIDALRARWLRPRAQSTLTQVNEVMVYMNDAPYGEV